MELTKKEIIGLIKYTSGEMKEDLIDVTEQDAESILNEYLEAINYTCCSTQLNESFKKGDKVIVTTNRKAEIIEVLENCYLVEDNDLKLFQVKHETLSKQ